MATERVWPDVAIPPGDVLAEELEARGLTQSRLARLMHRPLQAINEIVRGRKRITGATALELADALGTSAELWVTADNLYVAMGYFAALQTDANLAFKERYLARFGDRAPALNTITPRSACRTTRTSASKASRGPAASSSAWRRLGSRFRRERAFGWRHCLVSCLNALIRKKRRVTAQTALRLADFFHTSPELWLNLQTSWDLWHAYRAEGRTMEARLEKKGWKFGSAATFLES